MKFQIADYVAHVEQFVVRTDVEPDNVTPAVHLSGEIAVQISGPLALPRPFAAVVERSTSDPNGLEGPYWSMAGEDVIHGSFTDRATRLFTFKEPSAGWWRVRVVQFDYPYGFGELIKNYADNVHTAQGHLATLQAQMIALRVAILEWIGTRTEGFSSDVATGSELWLELKERWATIEPFRLQYQSAVFDLLNSAQAIVALTRRAGTLVTDESTSSTATIVDIDNATAKALAATNSWDPFPIMASIDESTFAAAQQALETVADTAQAFADSLLARLAAYETRKDSNALVVSISGGGVND